MAQVESGTLAFKSSNLPDVRSPTPVPVTANRPPLSNDPPLRSFESGHLSLRSLSSVNQNGSFARDRVLKSGMVKRRVKSKGAWKASWKPTYLVLRPNLLSMYKHEDETGLQVAITLSEVTAVARIKKANMDHVFGVFSQSKNYRLQANSEAEMVQWIEQTREEARVDAHEEVMLSGRTFQHADRGSYHFETTDFSGEDDDRDRSSSPESPRRPLPMHWAQNQSRPIKQRQVSMVHDYSGNEMTTSCSDFSDGAAHTLPQRQTGRLGQRGPAVGANAGQPAMTRNNSQASGFGMSSDSDRVVRQGWLNHLRTKGGVRQWKKRWIVLRPQCLSFYKDEQEYAATKILSMSSVINVGELDPISKSKTYCLQLNMEENKNYKFCAPNEDELVKWLGSFKSIIK